jgi:uncharacterized SAM-binding protein YcdF (DUF218 family)
MAFLIKKGLQFVLLPHSFLFLLLVLSIVLILCKKQRLGKRLLLLSVILFYLCSIKPVSHGLIGGLERRFPPLRTLPAGVQRIVILGGGIRNPKADLPVNEKLDSTSMNRLLEGLRLFRQIPEGHLVVSGGGFWGSRQAEICADLMARMAVSLGVPMEKIFIEPDSLDTDDQARMLAGLLGEEPFVLVTSAFHMPRSVKLFRREGMDPIPAPCDFRSKGGTALRISDFVPYPDRLEETTLAVREYYGLLFYRIFL